MKISIPTYNLELSEDELQTAIAYWLKEVHNREVVITHLKHNVGERTEGYGILEVDVPYQEGVTVICKEVHND